MSGWSETAARAFESAVRLDAQRRRWRKDQLIRYGARVGLTAEQAATLAEDETVDLETFRRLVERGATLEELLRVVA